MHILLSLNFESGEFLFKTFKVLFLVSCPIVEESVRIIKDVIFLVQVVLEALFRRDDLKSVSIGELTVGALEPD